MWCDNYDYIGFGYSMLYIYLRTCQHHWYYVTILYMGIKRLYIFRTMYKYYNQRTSLVKYALCNSAYSHELQRVNIKHTRIRSKVLELMLEKKVNQRQKNEQLFVLINNLYRLRKYDKYLLRQKQTIMAEIVRISQSSQLI